MEEKISIIIPIYNVSEYLEKCIKSVLNQTYKNIELVCINDGSTDDSLKIINELKKSDKRIRVFSRENKGLLFTRVEGVKKSSGKYITFLDSDDWIDGDYIETLYKNLKGDNCDVVRCNLKFVDNDGKIIKLQEDFEDKIYHRDKLKSEIYYEFCHSYKFNNAVKQLIKKDLLEDIDKIDTSISMGEDLEFNLSFYSRINTLKTIKYYGYNYRYNPKSITKAVNKARLLKNLDDEINVYCNMCGFIKKNNSELLQDSYYRLLSQITSHLMRVSLADKISFKEFYNLSKKIANGEPLEKIRKCISEKYIKHKKTKKKIPELLLYKKKVILFTIIVYSFYKFLRRQ